MLRAAFLAVLVSTAAADLASECMKALQLLDGENAVELAARCRASFGPEVCRQARRSLGMQPWSRARMQGSCTNFASAYEGMDSRTLEEAVSNKAAGSVDASTQGKTETAGSKTPAPTQKPQPQGPVANLLNRLQEGKAARKETTEAKEPATKVDKIAAEANDKQKHTQGERGPGPIGQLSSDAKKKVEEAKTEVKTTRARQEQSGPLAKMLEKMEEAKAAKQGAEQRGKDGVAPSVRSVHEQTKSRAPAAVKLYGNAHIQKPTSSETMSPALGAMVCAASIAAVTMFVASRRARTPTSDRYQLSVQPDLEHTVE